jgi:SAM-dependent methyltransferase
VTTIRSYSSGKVPALAALREAWNLRRSYSEGSLGRVRECIEDVRGVEILLKDRLGLDVRNLDVLEIGPGQFLIQMAHFSIHNRVVGIDLEVIVRGFKPLSYIRMIRTNGARRAAKTIGRKLLGVDRRFASELTRHLELRKFPKLQVLQMDVCEMSFPDETFDFVYSRAVFHHLPDPGAALDAIVRVLRPGGVAYIGLHPYTSETGCLDPRVYTERRNEVRGWPHLRPHLQSTVDNLNTYLNKLRLQEWHALFASKMAHAECILTPNYACIEAAKTLQSQGELLDYSLEELSVGQFAAIWKKPMVSSSAHSTEGGEKK